MALLFINQMKITMMQYKASDMPDMLSYLSLHEKYKYGNKTTIISERRHIN